MAHFSENLDYEKAQKSKEKIEILYNFQAKSTIVTSIKHNIDVFSINDDENFAYVNYLKTVNGTIIQVQNFEIRKKIGETAQEILPYAILDIYENKNFGHENVNEILLPFLPEFMLPYKKITIPTFGDKLKLLELSEKNGKYYRLEKNKQRTLVDPQRHSNRILLQMKEDLRMPVTPAHIECFDNSNIQGTSAVASCVVFKNAKPAKREYRKFNIKTVEGPDDFASMSEIIFRRYSRMINEKQTLPDLIIIDGGKGQLSAALESLDRLSLRGKVSIIGIAKKLEEIYFPGDQIPLYLNKNSETLKVIQHARDEAHRFGISFHRDKRSKKMTETELSKIEGVGTKTIEKLLKKFKSISKISKLSIDDLKNEVSQKQALKIFEKFHYISTDSVKSEIK
jgi:excinuclease ABC subunit C